MADADNCKVDNVQVDTNNNVPDAAQLAKADNHIVRDREGKEHSFKSLYSGPDSTSRVLIIFIRHFFCGLCQNYVQRICETTSPEQLRALPEPTSIVMIGCGSHELIDHYQRDAGGKFPIYADEKQQLFKDLGMTSTLDMGDKPKYLRGSVWGNAVSSAIKAIKLIPSGIAHKGGPISQVGGEFLLVPVEDAAGADKRKKVSWCHRMKTTRDHTEVDELKKVLGLGTSLDEKKAASEEHPGVGQIESA